MHLFIYFETRQICSTIHFPIKKSQETLDSNDVYTKFSKIFSISTRMTLRKILPEDFTENLRNKGISDTRLTRHLCALYLNLNIQKFKYVQFFGCEYIACSGFSFHTNIWTHQQVEAELKVKI